MRFGIALYLGLGMLLAVVACSGPAPSDEMCTGEGGGVCMDKGCGGNESLPYPCASGVCCFVSKDTPAK